MARIQIIDEGIELESPTLIEGLPGAGLVGKIAADHLVDEFDMAYYGALLCEGLPRVAVYGGDSPDLLPPVRLYADETRDLVVLQSDVPVSPKQATEFASCVTGWIDTSDAFPLYISGLAEEKADVPKLYGVAAGNGASMLDDVDIVPPSGGGLISGPTGALLHRAVETELDAVGLIAQTDPRFPDPEAARVVLEDGITPIAGIDVSTDRLVDQADEIQAAREQLAKRLQEVDRDESTQAQPIRGFQ
ncbi:proteasome assembly chaperone family protein [Natronomonas salsuginis]|uniref:Proteasome assembly chaperone family protein n=1 Tax=Natronomonas salsuginis TaxID=2217661 RepID=A0A4U5JI95_9EURY|nr:PAC2 family protein [Natronomonas salsuginis]TKR28236.1 proteasome assembly chaperone family protein [Natronomonas salsuginis]